MREPFWRWLEARARSLTPFLLTLFLLLLAAVPLHVRHLDLVGPGLALISVYYWSIHAPHLLRAPAVFLIGLVSDLLGGAPLGAGVLVLLLVHGIALSQRRLLAEAPLAVVWWGFVLLSAAAHSAAWLIAGALADATVSPRPAFFSYILSIAIYPLLAHGLARAQRSLAGRA